MDLSTNPILPAAAVAVASAVAPAACAPSEPVATPEPDDEALPPPPAYDSSPALRRAPKGNRKVPPPRTDLEVVVRWEGEPRDHRMPLRDALRRSRGLDRRADISAPGMVGEIFPRCKGWIVMRDES